MFKGQICDMLKTVTAERLGTKHFRFTVKIFDGTYMANLVKLEVENSRQSLFRFLGITLVSLIVFLNRKRRSGGGVLTYLDIRGCSTKMGRFFARNPWTWVPLFTKKSLAKALFFKIFLGSHSKLCKS